MKFGSTRAAGRLKKSNSADPFRELAAQGPGTGMPKDIFTTPVSKRRRWDNQALGDTPPRDGPFAQSAAGIVRQYPPRTRQSQRKKGNGLDPLK
jgi:hypothetical protein